MAPPIFDGERGLSPTRALRSNVGLPSPLNSHASDIHSSADDEHETKLQQHWDSSIAGNMNLLDGYHNVHVLMVKWHDDIDQLEVRSEVNDLTQVFRDVFSFDVKEVNLGHVNTQLQLEGEINTWAWENDDPDNLLIVYYAGHGIFDHRKKVLELTPDDKDLTKVVWNRAERPFLETVKADVFTIMDCCYASDLLRNVSEVGRTFEMLAASHIGTTTPQPGVHSFTRRLIKHLKELVHDYGDRPFTTWDIVERMQKETPDEAPALWRRLPGASRHIRLRKLEPLHERQKKNLELPSPERFWHLGFALKDGSLNEEKIERLTKSLPALFKEEGVPLVNITWLGYRKLKTRSHRFKDVAHWVCKNLQELTALSPVSDRKRTADEAGLREGSGEPYKRATTGELPKIRTNDTVV